MGSEVSLKYKTQDFLKENSVGVYLMAFLIPFNAKWLGVGILVLVLESLIKKDSFKKENFLRQKSWRNPGLWLFLFYILHLVGLLYSENMKFGVMDIGMKLAFVIFPLLFLFYRPKIDWRIFTKTWIVGAFLSILINLILSWKSYTITHEIKSFYGVDLTHLMHRGYWATYLSISYLFLVIFFIETTDNKLKLLNALGFLLIAVFIVLSESKMGVITLFILTIYGAILLLGRLKNRLKVALFFGAFVGVVGLIFISVPSVNKRFFDTAKELSISFDDMNKSSRGSSTLRLFTWHSSIQLMQENFFFGVGTGDIKDELIQRNKENGYVWAVRKELNSHNQFFNSHIALGVLAPILLFLVFVTNWMKIKPKDEVYSWRFWMVLILFLATLTESVLEVQAGIIPYAFLLTMLVSADIVIDQNQPENHPIK